MILFLILLFTALAPQIPSLGTEDRVSIVNDAFALAVGGYSATTAALDLLTNYKTETEYIVWNEIVSRLGQLRSVWAGESEEITAKLAKFNLGLLSNVATSLGWTPKEGESHLVKLLRVLVIKPVLSLGHPAFVQQAKEKFAAFAAGDDTAIHPDLRTTVFSTVLKNGGVAEFDQLVALYKRAASADEKVAVLGALSSGATAELLTKALDFALSDEVRSQDVIYITASIGESPLGRDVAWAYLTTNWTKFFERLGSGSFLLGRMTQDFTASFTSDEKADEVQAYFDKLNYPAIENNVKQGIESIRARARWLSTERESVAAWLLANVQ